MFELPLQLDLSLRLIIAAALGLAVGFEREIHGHPAGLRTHMLVSMGSALFTVLSAYGFGGVPNAAPIDPTRIAAQIVSGIGFLGAGAILKDGVVVRGLTTAASLWATSAVGMAAGAGEHLIAVVATVVILTSLWPINALAEGLHGSNLPDIRLRLEMDDLAAVGAVSAILVAKKIEVGHLSTERVGKGHYRLDTTIRGRPQQVSAALEEIATIEGVDVVSTVAPD